MMSGRMEAGIMSSSIGLAAEPVCQSCMPGESTAAGNDEKFTSRSSSPSSLPSQSQSWSSTHPSSLSEAHIEWPQVKDDLNNALQGIFPANRGVYTKVTVLLMYWKDDDLDCKSEVEELGQFFRDSFGYTTQTYIIPSKSQNVNPEMKLLMEILRVLDDHPLKSHLVILYYGGHGELNRQGSSVWVCDRNGSSKLGWHRIQPHIVQASCDALILLDCCYAAAAVRGTTETQKEVLAACGREYETPAPCDLSYTQGLMREMRKLKHQPFSIVQLHQNLMSDREYLTRTPAYSILGANSSIVLQPLLVTNDPYTTPGQDSIPSSSNTSVLLKVSLTEDPENIDPGEIARWLKGARVPPAIVHGIVVEKVYRSNSSLLLLTMPISVWDLLPENRAYTFLGFVKSLGFEQDSETTAGKFQSWSVRLVQSLSGSTKSGTKSKNPQPARFLPPLYSRFTHTVTCGASIGLGTERRARASFGGFVQLKFADTASWVLYGLTVHHLLENHTQSTPVGKGVVDGKMDGKEFRVTQPALFHFAEEKSRLCRYLEIQEACLSRFRRTLTSEQVEQYHREIIRIQNELDRVNRTSQNHLELGEIAYSSGYGETHQGHQMDWALIGDIPAERAQNGNTLPNHDGNTPTIFYEPGELITQLAGEVFLDTVTEMYQKQASLHNAPPEPCGRVHGCSAGLGLQSGYIYGDRSPVRLWDYGPTSSEYSFIPYGTLELNFEKAAKTMRGRGSSTILVNNSDFVQIIEKKTTKESVGAVVGMIIRRDEANNLIYFTPMHRIFEHIVKRTGASSIRIARFQEESDWQNFSRYRDSFESRQWSERDSGISMASRSRARRSFLKTHSVDGGFI